MAALRPVGTAVAVALWNVPLAAGLWTGNRGPSRGFLLGGAMLAGWLLAAWFSSAWRARFFAADAPASVTDGQVVGWAAGVAGMAMVGYALL